MKNITELANYALTQLGEGFRISTFSGDQSEEGQACRDTYQGLIEEKLREFRWNRFVQKAPLALVKANPNPVYRFSYRYPSNCLDFHRILNGDRSGLDQPRVPFILSSDAQGLLIFTDWGFNKDPLNPSPAAVYGEWTLANPPFNLWASDFKTAFAFEWASIIAPRILKGTIMGLIARLEAKAATKWIRAKANANREQVLDPFPVSRIQRARGAGVRPNKFNGRAQG